MAAMLLVDFQFVCRGSVNSIRDCAGNPLAAVLRTDLILVGWIGGRPALRRSLNFVARIAFALLLPVAVGQSRGVFVTPIPNASLMAVVNQDTLSAFARDRQGRIFNERRPLVPASATATPPILSIHIYDPQTGINTFIDPQQRVALQLNMLATHKDPRIGERTTAVTQLDRSEPAPAIFEIPSGYRVIHRGAAQ